MKKQPPPRPTAPKPALQKKPLELEAGGLDAGDLPLLGSLVLPELPDLPEELRSLPPDVLAGHLARLPPNTLAALTTGLRPPEPFLPAARMASAPLQPFAPARFPGPPALPGHYRLPAAPTSAPGPFPPGGGAPGQLLQPSAPQAAGPPQSSAPAAAPQLFPAAPLMRAPVQPGFVGPHVLPPRSSPQHGPLPGSTPAASYGLGQPGVPAPGPLAPPALGPAPMGSQLPAGGPEPAPGARPATTTVDSIQAPISSCTAPPRLPMPPGPFLAPQRPGGPPAPFPYAQGGLQPFGQPAQHPFPPGQHPRAFTPAAQLQPGMEMPARPQGPQQFPPAPFLPPGRAQVPLQYQPPARPPLPPTQPQFAQQPFTGPGGQPPLPPQLYQLPGQDKLPPQRLPPATGALSFPRAPGQSGPPLHPALGGLQPVPTSSPALPFCPSSAPPSSQMPPGTMALGPPQPAPASQAGPHHVPPSPSPGLSQMPGAVVVQGPLVPSPAPSPQPALPMQPPALVPGPQRPPPSLTPGTAPLPQGPGEVPFQRQSSSTDDLLSSSPESQHGGSKAAVSQPLLQPTKADAKEGQKPKAVQLIENDPYEKPERVLRLLAELDRFRGLVERLEHPGPGGGTELDTIWKELQDAQERDARQLSIAIARCYSMKNRHQDIMPYDRNRVVLRSGKDDYINASRVEDLSPYCPTIIATQAPLLGTAADFWLMIYEQKVSVVVMLVSEQELDKVDPSLVELAGAGVSVASLTPPGTHHPLLLRWCPWWGPGRDRRVPTGRWLPWVGCYSS